MTDLQWSYGGEKWVGLRKVPNPTKDSHHDQDRQLPDRRIPRQIDKWQFLTDRLRDGAWFDPAPAICMI
jgi:hypothetical protein